MASRLPVVGRPHRGLLVVIAAAALVAVGCALAQPLAARAVIDSVGANQSAILSLGILVGVVLVEASAAGLRTVLLERAGARTVFEMRRELVHRILRWPVRRYSEQRQGELISLLTTDTAQVHTLVAGGILELVTGVVLLLGAGVFMAVLSPLLFAITLTVIFCAGAVAAVASGPLRSLGRRIQDETAAMGSEAASVLDAIRTIRTAGATDDYARKLIAPAARARDAAFAFGSRAAIVSPVGHMATKGALLIVLVAGSILVGRSMMRFSDLVAFLMYLVVVLSPVENALRAIPAMQRARASGDRIAAALEIPAEEPQRAERIETACARGRAYSGVSAPSSLRFEKVCFRHGQGAGGIQDVTFTIRAGSLSALVGPSGGGTSTILDLVARLRDPDSGRILLDGRDLRSIDRRELSSRVAYLEQKAPLLDGTLSDNLRLAAPDASDEQLLRALDAVGLSHLVDEDRRGLHASLGASGRTLSGGESQRLALARTMLSPASIVIVDDPASHLDAESEARVNAVIGRLAGMRTVLVVTHRLHAAVGADHVFFLRSDGTIARGIDSDVFRAAPSFSRPAE